MNPFQRRFLVVEDHELQSASLEQMLLSLKASSVYTADDGRVAVKILNDSSSPVDVVISDLMMPSVDGIELIPHLVAKGSGIALILVSSDALLLSAAVQIAKGNGVNVLGAIVKPVTAEKLLPLLDGSQGQPAEG